MTGEDGRDAARDRADGGEEIVERCAIGADEVNGHIAVEGAQEVAIDGRDDGFGGGFVLEHEFAQVAVALRENRSGGERSWFGAASEGKDGAGGEQADDDAKECLPTEHGGGGGGKRET